MELQGVEWRVSNSVNNANIAFTGKPVSTLFPKLSGYVVLVLGSVSVGG
jgi:hypothetical protein